MADEEILRRALCGDNLRVDMTDDSDRIFAEVDSFVALSQGNDTIVHVELHPYCIYPGNYEFWDKVGQGVRNLKLLSVLSIQIRGCFKRDWEILARILPHIQSKIELRFVDWCFKRTEEMQAFARAIQEHPAIVSISAGSYFENAATLWSTLATLPNLESAVLMHQNFGDEGEEVADIQSPESITEFLRSSSLRSVEFRFSYFTSSLCRATAMALRQGSSITSLVLLGCYFSPEGGSEEIASALTENTTLTTFRISLVPYDGMYQAFYDAMAASLLSNSTLQDLEICHPGALYPYSICVSFLLMNLGMNKTLRKFHLSGFSSVSGSAISTLLEWPGKDSTLEILELIVYCVATASFRIVVVEALQLNKTVKTLRICYGTGRESLADDEVKHLTSAVKKNFGLESLPDLDFSDDRMGDLRCILRLNGAGRGYLLDGHGSVISQGVGVLIAVSDDLDCVFFHLLENPSLCKRSH